MLGVVYGLQRDRGLKKTVNRGFPRECARASPLCWVICCNLRSVVWSVEMRQWSRNGTARPHLPLAVIKYAPSGGVGERDAGFAVLKWRPWESAALLFDEHSVGQLINRFTVHPWVMMCGSDISNTNHRRLSLFLVFVYAFSSYALFLCGLHLHISVQSNAFFMENAPPPDITWRFLANKINVWARRASWWMCSSSLTNVRLQRFTEGVCAEVSFCMLCIFTFNKLWFSYTPVRSL